MVDRSSDAAAEAAEDNDHSDGGRISNAPYRVRRKLEPLDLLMLVATFGAVIWLIDPIYDINDVFWHVLIGDQIRAGTEFSQLGSNFSFSVENPDWRTGAWASEYLMSWLYDLGGWALLVDVMRFTSVLGVVFVLWRHVLRRWPARAVLVPYLLAMLALAMTVQERPQSISYVLVALSGVWWYRSTMDDQPPHWFLVGATAALWANLHGLWVLLPVVMALAFVGRMLNNGWTDDLRLPAAAGVVASIVGGCLTPLGPSGLFLAAGIQDSTSNLINEWAKTTLFGWPGYTLLVAGGVALFLLGKVSGSSRAEILYVVAVGVFGLTAQRNITPAVLLLTPLLASLIARYLGEKARVDVSRTERRRLLVAMSVLALLGIGTTAAAVASKDQGPPESLPVALASRLADEPGTVRLLNDYNWSGIALFYGGEGVQVGADGRADYYGAEYLNRYQDAVVYGSDLRTLVADLDPTHALLPSESAAAAILQDDGWDVVESSDDHSLLAAP